MSVEPWDDVWTVADSRSAGASASGDGERDRARALPPFDPGIAERPRAPSRDYLAAGARRFESGEASAAEAGANPVAMDRANYGLVPRGLDYATDFFSPGQVSAAGPGAALLYEPTRFLMECGPKLGSALLTTIQYPGLIPGPMSAPDAMAARHRAAITVDAQNQPSAFGVPTRPLDVPYGIVDSVRLGHDARFTRRADWVDPATGLRTGAGADQDNINMPGLVVGAVITNPQEFALASAHTRILRQLASVMPPEGHLSKLQTWNAVQRPVLTTNDWDWFFDPMITDLTFRERVHQLVCKDLLATVRLPTIYDNSTATERAQLRLATRILRGRILSSYMTRPLVVASAFRGGQPDTIVRVVPRNF